MDFGIYTDPYKASHNMNAQWLHLSAMPTTILRAAKQQRSLASTKLYHCKTNKHMSEQLP